MAEEKEVGQSCSFPHTTRHSMPRDPAITFLIMLNSLQSFEDAFLLTFLMADYTLNNPDTLTKYKTAAQISQKVLEAVTKLCAADEKIVTICERGDKLLEEEIGKVYRGKKITKGESSMLWSA